MTVQGDPTRPTTYCPRGARCESCGTAGPTLRVVVLAVLSAHLCLTLCARCAKSGRMPSVHLSTVEEFVEQHRQHVQRASGPSERRVRRLRSSGITGWPEASHG